MKKGFVMIEHMDESRQHESLDLLKNDKLNVRITKSAYKNNPSFTPAPLIGDIIEIRWKGHGGMDRAKVINVEQILNNDELNETNNENTNQNDENDDEDEDEDEEFEDENEEKTPEGGGGGNQKNNDKHKHSIINHFKVFFVCFALMFRLFDMPKRYVFFFFHKKTKPLCIFMFVRCFGYK